MIINIRKINKVFDECRARNSREEELCPHPVPRLQNGQGEYRYSAARLEENRAAIVSILKNLSRKMRSSIHPEGQPWVSICTSNLIATCDLDTAEHIALLGMALGYIRRIDTGCPAEDIPYVVLDDVRMNREEQMRRAERARENNRRRRLLKLKKKTI